MFEIIEVDPATGEEDQLIARGSLRRMERMLTDMIEDFMWSDWDECGATWPVWRLQPAT